MQAPVVLPEPERVVLFPVPDCLVPRLAGTSLFQAGKHVGQHRLDIADNRHVHALVLPDLGRIDIDMDHLRSRGEGIDLTGDPVIEPGPDGDQEIAFGDGKICVLGAMCSMV